MPYPGLAHDDHRILGSDYCSGFTDIYGKWNTGFYCPQTSPTIPVFCCGTTYYKYCCVARDNVLREKEFDLEQEHHDHPVTESYTVRVPVVFAIFCGVLAIVLLLVTAICFFCSCCMVYKKRRGRDHTPFSGLYHIQGSSSTTSALTSIYSNQNTNSSVVTTPLDTTDWAAYSPSVGGGGGYIPYSFLNSHYSTPFSHQAPPPPPPSFPSSLMCNRGNNNVRFASNNNNNVSASAFYYNNLNNNQQQQQNQNENVRNFCNTLSGIYRQHQPLPRPVSSLSTLSTLSQSTSSSLPRYFHPNSASGLYHVTNLQETPPPAYTFRPIVTPPTPTPEQVGLNATLSTTQLQLLQGSRNNHDDNLNTRVFNPSVNVNGRQLLQRSNLNTRGRTQNRSESQSQERLSLATVQSLINAYRNVNSRPLQQQGLGTTTTRPPSLTTADVNRLNAINVLVSTLLRQNHQQQRESGESAVGVLGVVDGGIRASSFSSGSGGESVSSVNTSSTNSNTTCSTTSGIGTCTSGSSDNVTLKITDMVPGNTVTTPSYKEISLQEEDNDEEIIQIIETSVPLTEHECFEVDKDEDKGGSGCGDYMIEGKSPQLGLECATRNGFDLDLGSKSNFNETSVLIDELGEGAQEKVGEMDITSANDNDKAKAKAKGCGDVGQSQNQRESGDSFVRESPSRKAVVEIENC